jgi:hypothetical protein
MPMKLVNTPYLSIRSRENIEHYFTQIRKGAAHLQAWLRGQTDAGPIELMMGMKFDNIGRHPIDCRGPAVFIRMHSGFGKLECEPDVVVIVTGAYGF